MSGRPKSPKGGRKKPLLVTVPAAQYERLLGLAQDLKKARESQVELFELKKSLEAQVARLESSKVQLSLARAISERDDARREVERLRQSQGFYLRRNTQLEDWARGMNTILSSKLDRRAIDGLRELVLAGLFPRLRPAPDEDDEGTK